MDDLSDILERWPYRPNDLTVRKITAADGRMLIQMRLDLGILQMEVTGRPDGRRPHGKESLLAYHLARLQRHRRRHGTDAGFSLSPAECAQLREESVQYYHRYLSLYRLEEFRLVVQDTERNLKCLDFLRAYAAEEGDRASFQEYRPYALMMHARAQAGAALQEGRIPEALRLVRDGIERIEGHLREAGRANDIQGSMELESLRRLELEIRRRMPLDRAERLRRQLANAVAAEDYERAAALRDELKALETSSS